MPWAMTGTICFCSRLIFINPPALPPQPPLDLGSCPRTDQDHNGRTCAGTLRSPALEGEGEGRRQQRLLGTRKGK